jgi:hypothetical protein
MMIGEALPPVRSVAHPRRPLVGPSQAYRLSRAFLLILLATTLDVTSFLNRGNALRYAILLPPLAVALGIRLRLHSPYIRRLRASDRILLLLFLWGMLGTLYGILFKTIPDPLLTLFGPMAIAFLYLGTLEGLTEEEAHRLLRNIAAIGALYICLNAFVNVGIVHGLAAYRQYRNAQLLFVAIGVAGAIVLRKRLRLTVLLLLIVVIFATYPSGTAILVFLVTAATLWMTKARGSSLRPLAVGAVLAVTLMLALSNFGWGVQLSSDYFQAVGKSNNTSTRAALWQAGIEKFQESPLVGRSFSGGTTVVARRVPGGRVIQLPFHNDYILFLTAGGLLGLGLFVLWAVVTDVIVLRRYRALLAAGRNAHADLIRVLLIAFNCFLCAAAFNPEVTGVSRSATIFAIYGVMMLAGRP